MKTLHLNLKRKWFDMIKSGEKKEEYREIKPFWITRLNNIKCASEPTKTVTFSNGYAKDREQFVIELEMIWIREGKPEWGAVPGKKYFVIELGEIRPVVVQSFMKSLGSAIQGNKVDNEFMKANQ